MTCGRPAAEAAGQSPSRPDTATRAAFRTEHLLDVRGQSAVHSKSVCAQAITRMECGSGPAWRPGFDSVNHVGQPPQCANARTGTRGASRPTRSSGCCNHEFASANPAPGSRYSPVRSNSNAYGISGGTMGGEITCAITSTPALALARTYAIESVASLPGWALADASGSVIVSH